MDVGINRRICLLYSLISKHLFDQLTSNLEAVSIANVIIAAIRMEISYLIKSVTLHNFTSSTLSRNKIQ